MRGTDKDNKKQRILNVKARESFNRVKGNVH